MPTEILRPNAKGSLDDSNGAVSSVNDNSDATSVSIGSFFDRMHVLFPTPTGAPDGTQTFYIRAKKGSGESNHTISPSLYENGSSLSSLTGCFLTSSFSYSTFARTWNASSLGTADGSLVELLVNEGSFSEDADIADVWWDVNYTVPVNVNVTGDEAAAEDGSVTATGGATTPLTGDEVAAEQGSVTASTSDEAAPTGQEVGAEQGSVTVVGVAILSVTGQEADAEQGDVVAGEGLSFAVSGSEASVDTGVIKVWIGINDSQTPSWGSIDDSETDDWSEIDDSQTPSWVEVPT